MTCYRCNEQGHQISECPLRKVPGSQQTSHDTNSWANMVKRGIESVCVCRQQWKQKRFSLSLTDEVG